MKKSLKILVFAGSLRKDSFNKKLAKWACQELEKKGHDITYFNMEDYPLPVYNQDIEKIPAEAIALEKMMSDHQIWLIASPEYNYSIPGGLKNLIDFVSRSPGNQPNLKVFNNKIIGLISTAGSSLGGVRSLSVLRNCLTTLGCIVVPAQANIGASYAAFDEDGKLKDDNHRKAVLTVLDQMSDMALRLV